MAEQLTNIPLKASEDNRNGAGALFSPPEPMNKQSSYHTMISQATEDRLAELKRISATNRSGKLRASIGATQNASKSAKHDLDKHNQKATPNGVSEKRHSLHTTDTEYLKQVEMEKRAQYEQQRRHKNRKLRQWQRSQKSLHQQQPPQPQQTHTVQHDDSHQLSPVHDNDNDTFDVAESADGNTKNDDTKSTTTTTQPHVHSVAVASNANLPPPHRQHAHHIINPCVPIQPPAIPLHHLHPPPHSSQKHSFGSFGRFFQSHKKKWKPKTHPQQQVSVTPDREHDMLQSQFAALYPQEQAQAAFEQEPEEEPPRRVVYELDDEKYDLYAWLTPLKVLGQGAYAAVIEVVDERTHAHFAVKKNRDVFNNVADARRILREIKLMMHMRHENVMSLLACVPPERWDINTFDDVYLLMAKCDTTLKKVIRSRQKLSVEHVIFFVYQMARALEYMHSGNIIHRDLKPENVLVNINDCRIKITDFGLARGVNVDIDTPQKMTEYVVTRWYRAPEVMCCKKFYDARIDVWSLGCILAELYTRRPFWKGQHSRDQLRLIFDTLGTPTSVDWITSESEKRWILSLAPQRGVADLSDVLPNAPPLAVDFIRHILVLNPHKRPTISQVIQHPFLASRRKAHHFRQCEKFNISFEFEKKIRTSFGVRHMMYEELYTFHRQCVQYERQCCLASAPKQIYAGFELSYARHNSNMYQLLVTGYLNQIADAFVMDIPFAVAKLVCMYSTLCFRFTEIQKGSKHAAFPTQTQSQTQSQQQQFLVSGIWNSCIEPNVSGDGDGGEWCNIFSDRDWCPDGDGENVYHLQLSVNRIVSQSPLKDGRDVMIAIGVINSQCLLHEIGAHGKLTESFKHRKYDRYAFGVNDLAVHVNQIVQVVLDFGYDEKYGLLTICCYPDREALVATVKKPYMIPKKNAAKYRFAVAMRRNSGVALEAFHYSEFV